MPFTIMELGLFPPAEIGIEAVLPYAVRGAAKGLSTKKPAVLVLKYRLYKLYQGYTIWLIIYIHWLYMTQNYNFYSYFLILQAFILIFF